MKTSNCYNKHLNLSNRILIEQLLNDNKTFKEIGTAIGKSNRTISYEVKKHRQKRNGLKVNENTLVRCPLTDKPPYVCNGCIKKNHCRKTRYYYSAEEAHMDYKNNLTTSRTGIDLTNEEFIKMNRIITEEAKNGQSFYMICQNHKDEFPVKARTLYNYVEKQYLDIKNYDLPRKVRYKKRKKRNENKITKTTKHRLNRTYKDFIKYISDNPTEEIVEMDTVEGIKGENESVLLTLFWRRSKLLLAIKLDHKTSECVSREFERIKSKLGYELFHRLFAIILTDNGSEFSNPDIIEFNGNDVFKSRIFYCDARASQQKGSIEVAHEYIRRFIPKGISFNNYTQDDIDLMINHINNTVRKSLEKEGYYKELNTPYKLHRELMGKELLNLFNLYYIDSKKVILKSKLFNCKGDGKNDR